VDKSYFLVKVQGGSIEFVDNMSMVHLYPFRFKILPKIEKLGALDDNILLGKCFIRKVIEYLDRRFTNLHVLNFVEFFSHWHYYEVNYKDSYNKVVEMFM